LSDIRKEYYWISLYQPSSTHAVVDPGGLGALASCACVHIGGRKEEYSGGRRRKGGRNMKMRREK
jgi:hypothetical protein